LGAAEAQSPAQAKYSWVAMRNFNQAADNNKAPILKELQRLFSAPGKLLEIGSGSGQHAMHMANLLPGVIWQPTEVSGNLPLLAENLSAARCSSLMEPLELEVGQHWPDGSYRYAYLANVLHIIAEELLRDLFAGLRRLVQPGGMLACYGPFKYGGSFTTDSNARFDDWLRRNYSAAGIRDIETIADEAELADFRCIDDIAMPANNQLLVFCR